MEDQDQRAEAKKAVNAKIAFYVHLTVYVLVNAGLIAVNLSASGSRLWFQWPLLGWGIGVLVHALAIFVLPRARSLRERMVEREMKKKTAQKP